jgi:hypothetical protein
MEELLCPGCGERIPVFDLKVGARIDCSNCANLALRLKEKDGTYFLEEIPQASCPRCERTIEVPDGRGPGDTVTCCGEEFILTREFGAYALEKAPGRPSKGMT